MKRTLVFVAILTLFAGSAFAQTPLTVDGSTGKTTAAAPVTVLGNGSTTGYFIIGSRAGGPYDAQYVLEFDMAGQPNVATATLTLWASNAFPGGASGTFFLYQMTGVDENGVLDASDHTTTAAVSLISSIFMAYPAGATPLSFDVKDAVNFDVNNARPYSGYILTYAGGGVAGVASSTHEFPTYRPSLTFTPVPEPGTLALFGLGLMTFAAGYRVRRKKRASRG